MNAFSDNLRRSPTRKSITFTSSTSLHTNAHLLSMSSKQFYGSSSNESGPPTNDNIDADHVRVLLMDDSHRTALMTNGDEGWDFPAFFYKTGIDQGDRMKRVCHQFANWFGHDLHFVAVVELIGDFSVDGETPRSPIQLKLVVMELVGGATGLADFELSDRTEWKDRQFLTHFLEGLDEYDDRSLPLKTTLRVIEEGSNVMSSIDEPRLHFGWFNKASQYLESIMNEDDATLEGSVVQSQMSLTSTVLIASSAQADYFLKAPVKGSREIKMTETISQLFPGLTPRLLGVSSDLGCYVTKEFEHDQVEGGDAVKVLAKIHMKSLSCIDQLKEAGCVVRDLDSIRDQLKRWVDNYSTERVGAVSHLMGSTACYLMYCCRRLGELKIPLTLIHGDFAYRQGGNTAYDPPNSKNVILFDWEYACISHPFLDFYRTRTKLSTDIIDEYLELWKDYGDPATLREAFMYGSQLGRVLRAWTLWDRAEISSYQYSSSLESWMRLEITIMHSFAKKELLKTEDYESSPEAAMEKTMNIFCWDKFNAMVRANREK